MIEITGLTVMGVKGDRCIVRVMANIDGKGAYCDIPYQDDASMAHMTITRFKRHYVRQAMREFRRHNHAV